MYAELKCRTNFSFLRGASDAREYIERADQVGLQSLAITDINGVYALPRAYEALKKHPHIKMISGTELTFSDHSGMTLLAKTRAGYALMCRLITEAHRDKEKGEAHLTKDVFLKMIQGHPMAQDFICLTALEKSTEFGFLKDVFQESLFLTLCRYIDGLDEKRTEKALAASREFSVPIVAINDVHYHVAGRRYLQDSLTCIREGTHLKAAGFKLFGNEERYLKSPLQMRSLFYDLPAAIENTLKIAEACTFSLSELKYTYPKEFIPSGMTSQSYLEACVFEGAHVTYRGLISDKIDRQLRHELSLIQQMDYADYFLTIADIVKYARAQDILCQGRGSAANSLVCYVLGITSVDPVQANLLFERFISLERAEPPDIDVDFEHERREEVIQYIYRRYGRERAAMVSAVRTYQRKSSFLEISKSLGIPVGSVSADVLEDRFDEIAGDLKDQRPLIDQLVAELKEFPRHLSIHSGGFVLSDTPLTEIVPIEPARMEGRTICQWDKNDLETLGLMKVDILALGFLTALNKVSKTTGRDWRDIPLDDKPTYAMIRRAETEGTFQIESRAQRSMLVKTLPREFYDLVVQVAIVRPGPSVGEMVHPYIKRRESTLRGKPYVIEDPDMKEALGRTYGVPIFQEQVMKVAMKKAGFSAGEADQLRRTLAGWRSAEGVNLMAQKLYEGLLKNGVPTQYADELFGYMKGYAHYGFPESHAASFAAISYKSAYFKKHYPADFLCGLINSQPMGFYPIDTLINEAKRQGVVVLPIDPHRSLWDATLTDKKEVLMGFRNVRKINPLHVDDMILQRSIEPFSSVHNFLSRTLFPRDVIENLAMGDVFECFGCDQRHTFWNSIELSELLREKEKDQLVLFADDFAESFQHTLFDEMNLVEAISSDYRVLGYSARGNIMKGLRSLGIPLPFATSDQIRKMNAYQIVEFAGVLTVLQRPPTAKGVAFLTLEDEFGSVDVIAQKEIYEKYRSEIRNSRFLKLKARVQRQGTGVSLLLIEIEALSTQQQHKPIRPGEAYRMRPVGYMGWTYEE